MKKQLYTFVHFLTFLTFSSSIFGQSQSGSSNMILYSILGIGLVFIIGALVTIADNLLQVEARKAGGDTTSGNYGIFPSLQAMFGSKKPDFAADGGFHKFKKGFDIKLVGKAKAELIPNNVTRFAVKPQNFIGISPIPKVLVEVGDEVKAGDPIFFDKQVPDVMYAAPVSGEVVAVNRGEKRSIAEVIILADKAIQYKSFNIPDLQTIARPELVAFLASSGFWPMINQRPYDTVPDLDVIPKNIFISTFDTAPLAPDLNFVVKGRGSDFQKGIDVLTKLTSGKVVLGLNGASNDASAPEFSKCFNVEKHYFAGHHPSGNVGIQIHNTYPIKPGDKVWTLNVQEVLTLGKLFNEGVLDCSRIVAITGSEIIDPGYVSTHLGASVKELLQGNLKADQDVRLVSGDILSGEEMGDDDFLNFHDDQVTTVIEGDHYEMLGWLIPLAPRPSISGTYPNGLYPNLEFEVTTNTHGERRAFVVTGQYESVLPMNIYPQQLMKAIMANNIEKMEGLGIHELTEEDLALCEFVCTSKIPLQQILRQGLEELRAQE